MNGTWEQIIETLEEWKWNPDGIAEDDLTPPTEEALDRATRLAVRRDTFLGAPPIRIVPDGDGGVSIELACRPKKRTETIEIDSDGVAVFVAVNGCKVVTREEIYV